MIYLDNAATSWQKPEAVYRAADNALRHCSGNPGRSGHNISVQAGKITEEARIKLAGLFGADDPNDICFTTNATTALNTAIMGTVKPGSHIITGPLEHNSVTRPLTYLESLGCRISTVPASLEYGIDPDDIKKELRQETSLVVISHISNVTGTMSDISAIGKLCRAYDVPFLVDAAQSAGTRVINVQESCIDMLAFPGHKGLLGPQGTGGLYIRKDLDVNPLTRGGTGSFSELQSQPEERPSRYESGTLNVPGFAGLAAAVDFIQETGIDNIHAREQELRQMLISRLTETDHVSLYCPSIHADAGCLVSFTIEGIDPADISMMLNASFDIAVRAGLHCAPSAHTFLGTINTGGTVRVSPGFFTTDEEIETFADAVRMIAE